MSGYGSTAAHHEPNHHTQRMEHAGDATLEGYLYIRRPTSMHDPGERGIVRSLRRVTGISPSPVSGRKWECSSPSLAWVVCTGFTLFCMQPRHLSMPLGLKIRMRLRGNCMWLFYLPWDSEPYWPGAGSMKWAAFSREKGL